MSTNLFRESSLKSFHNEETTTYNANQSTKLLNLSHAIKNKEKQNMDKSFQFFYTAKGSRSKENSSSLSRANSSSDFKQSNSGNRKPLHEILQSNKQNSFHGLTKESREKLLLKTTQIQSDTKKNKNQLSFKKPPLQKKIHQRQVSNFNTFQEHQTKTQIDLQPIKLRESVQYVKTLQQQSSLPKKRSQSGRRKGLECTLYQKSLQKKMNQSGIMSHKKNLTVKKKDLETENKRRIEQQANKKDVKKVTLKRKNKENNGPSDDVCFNSIVIHKKVQKEINKDQIKIQESKQTQTSLIPSTSNPATKKKSRALSEMKRSMCLMKQSIQKHSSDSLRKKSQQVKKRIKDESITKSIMTKSKQQSLNFSAKSKKITMNQRTQANLEKIHQKYKFILNYLSDFEIIGKLNGYQIAGKQECKWILLLIDEVYEMIKHSDETKLKGMEYTRDYQFFSLHHKGTQQQIK